MKSLVILVGVIVAITYIFFAGPKGDAARAAANVNRREAVWERIAQLETDRRAMLFDAKLRSGGGAAVATRSHTRRSGRCLGSYFAGFDEGYYEGSFMADNSSSSRFFQVPPR